MSMYNSIFDPIDRELTNTGGNHFLDMGSGGMTTRCRGVFQKSFHRRFL